MEWRYTREWRWVTMLVGSASSEGGCATGLAQDGCMDIRRLVFELARVGVAVMTQIDKVRREIALEWLGSVIAEMWDFVAGWMAGHYM
jgi:hypothetical protein